MALCATELRVPKTTEKTGRIAWGRTGLDKQK